MRYSRQALESNGVFAKFARWAKQASERTFHIRRLNIGPRLTLCFVIIILAMLAGNAVLLWQFHLAQAQAERLSGVDRELITVLQVHTDLMSFLERLNMLARSEDAPGLLKEVERLRNALLEENQRSRNALRSLPPEVQLDPTLLPTLEAIQSALPPQLEAIAALARSRDWEAVRLRLANEIRPLESKTSTLAQDVDREVGEERAQAILSIRQARRRILLIAPLTAVLTLLIAAFFGLAIRRSITQPLGWLMEASKALARGDFQNRVSFIGGDELAHLGQVFNETAGRLRDLYESLYTKEAYLAEAQRLSHTGSFGWNVSSGEIFWSEETFRIFQAHRSTKPTVEFVLQRVHPEDRALVEQTIERASQDGKGFDFEHRLLMPDGLAKYVHVVAGAARDEQGEIEFTGSIIDVTDHHEARAALETAFEEIKELRDQLYKENLALKDEIDRSSMFEEIVGASPALQSVLARVAKVAPTDSTVLVTGETGTGKELIARAVHKRSQRSSRAFVSVNCAAIPRDLIASELFGHEKGAFTGAAQQRLGRFELAEGGTVFLDEVGELPAETQVALLRVLQEHEFERVGGTRTIQTDVRVIAATNRDVEAAIAAGSFRSDLLYRLNVFPIEVPPLRDRKEDIPLLVEYFIDRYARKAGKTILRVNKKTLDLLQSYPWPGNIRELQNVIQRSVILCATENFSVDESWLSRRSPAKEQTGPLELSQRLAAQEKQMIEAALRETGGRIFGPKGAAARLGIARSTLEARIRSLRINKYQFKSGDPSKSR
jgi:transcriptional regulator with GAF, ATPase, and Fis domain/HAMP domain-containing protein